MGILDELDIARVRADNPGLLTLSGTNSWVVGRDPAYVVDPGPALDPHLTALTTEIARRGGLAGIALTHSHSDHAEATTALLERAGEAPVAAVRPPAGGVQLADGDTFGPLLAVATPGHAPDHVAFVFGRAGFSGDAVLGEGSVFVDAYPGAMAAYLDGIARLRALELVVLCPGHGPPIEHPHAKLDEYIEHRLERESRLVAALERGLRGEAELLDAVWDDTPQMLRPAAALTLRAHLDKLRAEERLPPGV